MAGLQVYEPLWIDATINTCVKIEKCALIKLCFTKDEWIKHNRISLKFAIVSNTQAPSCYKRLKMQQ